MIIDFSCLKQRTHTLKPLHRFLLFCLLLFSKTAFAGVDLVVNMSDSPDPVSAGGLVTYPVRLTNDGDTDATNTILYLNIPANSNFISATGTGISCNPPAPNPVICNFGTLLANGGQKTVDVILQTVASGIITLSATSESDGPEETAANNTESEQTTVNTGADLELIKSGPANAQSGEIIDYAFTITNNGPDDATSFRVSDPIPSGFSLISLPAACSDNAGTIECDAGPLLNGNSVVISPITGRITAASASTVTNSASVAATAGAGDPDTSDNTSTFNTAVSPGTDMAILKSRSVAGDLLVGDTFDFILSPDYSGEAPSNITITDTIPAQYSIDAGNFATSQNGWSCNITGQLITCSKAGGGASGVDVPLGDISIPVQAVSAGNGIINSANISALSPPDVDLSNNDADDGGVNIAAPVVDLGIDKSGPSPALAVLNTPFNFTFSISNSGNTDFSGPLTITDNLPANQTLNNIASANGWTCLPTSGAGPLVITCDKNAVTITAGGTHNGPVFNVETTAVGNSTNSASISTSACNIAGDCLGANADDTDSFGVTTSAGVDSADIVLLKTAALATVPAGDIQTYTLEIVNNGPTQADDVDVTDLFESLINNIVGATGSGYVSNPEVVTANSAIFNNCSSVTAGNTKRRMTCNFTSVPVCTQGVDCPTIEVQVRHGGNGGILINTATAFSQVTPDPVTSNNDGSSTITIDPRADVFVSVTDTPDPATAGQNLTYDITASNRAPSQALDVTITDTLPLDVTFVSATPSTGSCSVTPGTGVTTTAGNRTLVCNLGRLAKGSIGSPAQQTVTVIVRPNNITRGTQISYNSSVSTSTTEVIGGGANNTAVTTTDINPPELDLVINMSEDVDPVAIGDATSFTIEITNNGPSASENVTVTNDLPATLLSFQSVTLPAGVNCPTQPPVNDNSGAQVICNLGNILAGDTVSFQINMQAVSKGIVANTSTVSSDEVTTGFESPAANNTAAENTTIRSKADMEVFNKQAQNLTGNAIASVNLREDFQFLVQVRNNVGAGLAEADDVLVSDNLPAGMELTGTPSVSIVSGTASAAVCTGVATDTSFSCDLGTVSSGGEINIIVPVQIITAPGGVITNTASVSTSSRDIDAGNDSSSGTITNGNVLVSTLSGKVYRDFNDNASIDAPLDTGIAGVTINLAGNAFDGAPITMSTTSDINGDFSFTNLPASDAAGYTLTEAAIADNTLSDGQETAGSLAGITTVNDVISGIVLPDNTTATGYLFAEVPVFRIGVAKAAGAVNTIGDGTHEVDFTLIIENSGFTALSNVQLKDDLADFGTYSSNANLTPGQYTITAAPVKSNETNNASITVNPNFTGSGANKNLLVAANSDLPDFDTGGGNQSQAQVDFSLRFFPVVGKTFNNTAIASATSSGGQTTSDDSVNGADPDGGDNDGDPGNNSSPTPVNVSGQSISISKTTGNVVQTGLRSFDIPYTVIVSNPATIFTANFVQLHDNLSNAFPSAESISIATPAAVSNCTGTANLRIASPVYDGITQTSLLDGSKHLQPGEQCQIDFTVHVEFNQTGNLPNIQTNTVLASVAGTRGGNSIDSDTDTSDISFANLASVSGRVWRDNNHDRIDNGEPGVSGFLVEVFNARGQLVGSVPTDSNGNYIVAGLFPSVPGDNNTLYRIRFVDIATNTVFGRALSRDPNNPNGLEKNGQIISLPLVAGVNTINQSLPLDPSGVIYDSLTREPIENAQVSISGPAGFDPAIHLVGGINNANQTTGPDGLYQFLLQLTAPAGTYTLSVLEPAGYLPGGSAIIPPCSNTLNVAAAPDPLLIQNTSTAPLASTTRHDENNCPGSSSGAAGNNNTTQYYLSFVLDATTSADVLNNHIPLDLITDGALTLVKSTTKLNVTRGELVPYSISASNNFSSTLPNIDVIDQIPPGFKYKPGSGRMAGVAVEPDVNGRTLSWSNLSFAANEQRNFTLLLIVGSGVNEGKFVNQAWAENNIISQRVSNIATATVRVIPDPTFDCTDIIGKVFDDKNLNGYHDEGEETLPGIRLATARGWLITTDNYGRYHITCAAVPNPYRGSNFIIKLDEHSLPSGYRVTTENPRVARLTRGKLAKVNFGAAIHRVVRLDLADDAFVKNSTELKTIYIERIDGLLNILKKAPSVLRINYLADYETEDIAEDRLEKAKTLISEKWQVIDCCYNLIVEEEIFWRTGKPRTRFSGNSNREAE